MDLKDFNLKLYWGLDTDTYLSTNSLTFKVDLTSPKVLFNIYPSQCDLSNNCQRTSKNVQKDVYRNLPYSYYDAKTFLYWDSIESGLIHSKEQYNYLRLFEVKDVVSNEGAKGNKAMVNIIRLFSKNQAQLS